MLCVHAHPDDEALFTAGVQAHYAAQGVRQVLITCTEGNLGFDPLGRGPLEEDHDSSATVAARRAELEASCALLGIDRLVQLGYHDSGMDGWQQNAFPAAFINQDTGEIAARIVEVIEKERPQVVVTYADDGFYGHPDHIKTHLATMAAVEECSGIVQRVYFVAMAKSTVAGFIELARASGMLLPEWLEGDLIFGSDDELVQTSVDCSDVVGAKHRALAAHASQVDNADLVGMDDELFDAVFSVETFVRGLDRTGSQLPENDLFVGITGR